LEALELHKAMILFALARILKKGAYAETKDLEDAYNLLCEEVGEKARGHTQIWKYLLDLEAQGLVAKKLDCKGSAGTIAMITLMDCTTQELIRALEPKVYKRE
jgi:hypothetical protein